MMRDFSVLGVCLLVMAAFWIGTVVSQGFASRVIFVQIRCRVYSHHSNSHLYIFNKQLVLRSHSWLFVYYLYPPGPKARAKKGLPTSKKHFFRGYVWICMDMYGYVWIMDMLFFLGVYNIYIYSYIYIYTHIYIYIHTYIHIYIYTYFETPWHRFRVFEFFRMTATPLNHRKIFPSDRPGWCSRATQGLNWRKDSWERLYLIRCVCIYIYIYIYIHCIIYVGIVFMVFCSFCAILGEIHFHHGQTLGASVPTRFVSHFFGRGNCLRSRSSNLPTHFWLKMKKPRHCSGGWEDASEDSQMEHTVEHGKG